ncbi:cache domain-containing protein, partial [Cloacibacillus evryensis]|nr:cache domain-containing protein [Cloacibacillus evryensis]
VFVNCKIKDSDGAIMGVVGVGMRVRNLQELLRSYDRQYGLNTMLVDEEGTIQISSEETGDNRASHFDSPHYAASRGNVLGEKNKQQIFWTRDGSNEIFVAA